MSITGKATGPQGVPDRFPRSRTQDAIRAVIALGRHDGNKEETDRDRMQQIDVILYYRHDVVVVDDLGEWGLLPSEVTQCLDPTARRDARSSSDTEYSEFLEDKYVSLGSISP